GQPDFKRWSRRLLAWACLWAAACAWGTTIAPKPRPFGLSADQSGRGRARHRSMTSRKPTLVCSGAFLPGGREDDGGRAEGDQRWHPQRESFTAPPRNDTA